MLSLTSPGRERSRRGAEGFTLLEILVATVILAIVLTIAYSVFSSSYSALRRLDPDRDHFHVARVVLDRMADEIQSAYYRPGLQYTGFVGTNDEKDDAPWDSLTFSSMANFYWIGRIEGITESDFLKISYALVEDETGNRLIRRQDPSFGPLEDDLEEDGFSGSGVHQLADGVWGINLRYFTGTEWVEEWNAAESEGLPRAVEVQLILETAAGDRVPFYAVIPIRAS